jgi:hypothetical protein
MNICVSGAVSAAGERVSIARCSRARSDLERVVGNAAIEDGFIGLADIAIVGVMTHGYDPISKTEIHFKTGHPTSLSQPLLF